MNIPQAHKTGNFIIHEWAQNALMDHPFKDIGTRVVQAREALGLTQAEFARLAGLKPSTVNQWETGAQRVSLNGALVLRKTYGLSLDFIFCGNVDALPRKIASALSSRP